MGERYSSMGGLAAFEFLANALDPNSGADGDRNAPFPRSDAEDLSRGARFIPSEVTLARRAGKRVLFVCRCSPCCWYWEMPDGIRIYHWDRRTFEQIAQANGETWEGEFHGKAERCPKCGNPHTSGGTVKPR